MARTKIEWADVTWNPTSGCTKLSPGCEHCYAERMARRLKAMGNAKYAAGFKLALHEDALREPLDFPRHFRRLKVFVDSMSDLFHPHVPMRFLDRCFAVMSMCDHTFLILTKRPERAAEYFADAIGRQAGWAYYAIHEFGREDDGQLPAFPLPNVWLGTSIENMDVTDRIGHLLKTPAAIRFLSCEPLLERVDLGLRNWADLPRDNCRLDWVIAGGESGPQARPTHPDWVRLIRDDCQLAGVPFFFKQWGEWKPDEGDVDARGRDPWDWLWMDDRGGLWNSCVAPSVRIRRMGKKTSGR